MQQIETDVLVVGYGPVGQAMAIMLAQRGHRVLVVERKSEPYPLPRAVCMDHEIRRVMLAMGCGSALDRSARPSPTYRWLNAAGDELLSIDWAVESVSGGPEAYFFHQPSLEQAMQKRALDYDAIDVRLGWELRTLSQDVADLSATIGPVEDGDGVAVTARFLIGADGANSFVRRSLGIGQEDGGFQADWLVVDVSAEDEAAFGVSGAVQVCDPGRPTTMVPGGVCDGRLFRRWEFMRLPGESREELERTDTVWSLLAPWTTPDRVRLHKHVLYTFRSLIAREWRHGRILLVGDAAHVMPPFMGQGMCSGLRDDWNLVWKLDLVLRGLADDSLLDTYQVERQAHVAAVIDASVSLGRIICVADEQTAAARDRAFLDGTAPAPAPFPVLTGGLIAREARHTHLAGHLSPHADVSEEGAVRRLDDIAGSGFLLVVRHREAKREARAALAANAYLASLCGVVAVDDFADDTIQAFLDRHGLDAYLARPDFYIYGTTVRGSSVANLVDELAAEMPVRARHGQAENEVPAAA